ncbi:hypothetical protein HK102_007376, partial [Quaeritorhiza haematococci]
MQTLRAGSREYTISARHWVVLFLSCLVAFGNYYCYDIPAAINVPLQKWLGSDYNHYQWQLNLLYSVYSLPNIFMPLVGGILVDRLGAPIMLLLFATAVCIGQTIFALGVSYKTFFFMVVGRSIFGVGGESLEVAQSRITTDWFQGKGLAFALGLNLSFARIATAVNDNVSPWIERHYGTPVAVWCGFVVCIFSYISGLAIFYLHYWASWSKPTSATGTEAGNTDNERRPLLWQEQEADEDITASADEDQKSVASSRPSVQISRSGYGSTWDDQDSTSITGSIEDDDSRTVIVESIDEVDGGSSSEKRVFGLGLPFWLLCITTITVYGAAVPFFHISTDFFQQKWYPGDTQRAGLVMSIPDIISAIGSPLCGLFLDRFGHRSLYLPISAFLIFFSHFLMCYSTLTPFIAMSILGVAYSMFASALWPSVPFLVGKHQIATAYGLVT